MNEEAETGHVLTLEEIAKLASDGVKPAETLMNVVALIATRFKTDVCSAYLLEPDRSNLVLAATLGLHPRCIGTLRMATARGLGRTGGGTGAAGGRGRCAETPALQILQGVRAKSSTSRFWAFP